MSYLSGGENGTEFADDPNEKRPVDVDPSIGLQGFEHVEQPELFHSLDSEFEAGPCLIQLASLFLAKGQSR